MIPAKAQLGTEDVHTWHARPHPDNPDGDELGAWLVTAGDDEPDVWIEVLHTEYPERLAKFLVDAVQQHTRTLRLEAALADVAARRQAEHSAGEPRTGLYCLDRTRLAHLIADIGQVSVEFSRDRGSGEWATQACRLYPLLAQVAATCVAWMEDIHSIDTAAV